MDEEKLEGVDAIDDEAGEDADVVDIDIDEDEESTTDDGDDDFEYDDEGNIIIPEVIEDTEEDEPEEADETEEEETDPPVEDTPDASGEADETKADEVEQTKRELEDLRALVLEVAAKLGTKNEDAVKALAEIAAECDGMSSEEFLKKREAEQVKARAEAQLRLAEFEKLAAADLVELHTSYPETKVYGHIRELPEGIRQRYAQLRDKGLSAKEAYAAANPDGIRATVAETVKKQSTNKGKDHLRSSVPKGSRDTSVDIPKKVLAEWRDLFPKLSDKEIATLYRQTADKEK